jgi:hypothetical protein
VKQDEKVIKEIITRYGENLNLKKNPYIILEILRQYGPRIGGGIGADCAPPGGPPRNFDPSELVKELTLRVADLSKLATNLQKAMKSRSKSI